MNGSLPGYHPETTQPKKPTSYALPDSGIMNHLTTSYDVTPPVDKKFDAHSKPNYAQFSQSTNLTHTITKCGGLD